ncbi:MAG: response regulator transcription factor [Bacteroidales bacterium]|jgi:DNA-binding response OmpR family regulator|nr:response regulator transcription factor [Bacteroidales bacterium]
MNGKKILFVEDDKSLNYIVRDQLKVAGYDVREAYDGERAWELFEHESFDLCLLDVMLPQIDGFSLAQQIRNVNQMVPILFLTAKSMHEDLIYGFSVGGDDYITKPFEMDELLMRISVFLRRRFIHSGKEVIKRCRLGRYMVDFDDALTMTADDGTVKMLTYKEAQLLQYFCDHTGQILNRSDILKQVWGSDDYYLGRSLDVFISHLRKYTKEDPDIKIVNLHGIGFKFVGEVSEIQRA